LYNGQATCFIQQASFGRKRQKEVNIKLDRADPKPSDLIAGRLKVITKLEDRTGERRKVLG